MRPLMLLALLVTLAIPPGSAASDGPDFRVGIALQDSPVYEGPEGWLQLVEAVPGERYVWNVSIPGEYATGAFHVQWLPLERPRQLVPTLVAPGEDYPLFEPYPDERVWEAGGAVRVFHIAGGADDFTLRLGIPGGNATLVLQRDVSPPAYALLPAENVTHRDFYRETRTDELALADLQVREVGTTDWVPNPTTVYHFRQRFPVQGLGPATDYETRVVFTDWAGNQATSPVETLRTLPAPILPMPVVTPLDPAPNATVENGSVTLRARIVSAGSPIEGGDIRLFFDKAEVREGLRFDGEVFSYEPPRTLAAGFHSVAIEATNAAGGTGIARWTFTVPGAEVGETSEKRVPSGTSDTSETRTTPGAGVLPLLVLVGVAGLVMRRLR